MNLTKTYLQHHTPTGTKYSDMVANRLTIEDNTSVVYNRCQFGAVSIVGDNLDIKFTDCNIEKLDITGATGDITIEQTVAGSISVDMSTIKLCMSADITRLTIDDSHLVKLVMCGRTVMFDITDSTIVDGWLYGVIMSATINANIEQFKLIGGSKIIRVKTDGDTGHVVKLIGNGEPNEKITTIGTFTPLPASWDLTGIKVI